LVFAIYTAKNEGVEVEAGGGRDHVLYLERRFLAVIFGRNIWP
jgi:hypothetical protein